MAIARVFVANRGEIAVRIVRACRKLGLEAVVGTSEVDRDGLAARMADRAVCIGPAAPEQSYLNVGAVVQAALGTGCDAIHPGYGFLSENPALAAAAREHGLRFVGPHPEVIALAGDKLRSREAAEAAGLPVVPGGEVRTLTDALRFADDEGYPVLLKAAAGGGGLGIKLVWRREELEGLFGVAFAEARAAFGDERLYVERFIRATSRCRWPPTSAALWSTWASATARCSVATRSSSRRPRRRRLPTPRAPLSTTRPSRSRARSATATSARSSSWSTPTVRSSSSSR